jgi:hypothetical protein
MDSMRSLNTSLPGASPSKQVNEPPEQILSAFKAAALSVTKLYQTAAADQGRARSEGYQDALDDLLAFLDKEDIGLSDGEGWRIRRWATERLDGRGDSGSQTMESEDEAADKTDRGSSPELHRSQSATRFSSTARAATRTVSPARGESLAPPMTNTPPASDSANTNTIPPQGVFTFRATQQYPQDSDMIVSDLSSDPSETRREGSHTSNPSTITRPRTNQRHGSHSARQPSRTATSLGRTGQKRKFNVGDITEYFDFSGFGNGRDNLGSGGGGGKRGRFV